MLGEVPKKGFADELLDVLSDIAGILERIAGTLEMEAEQVKGESTGED